MRIGWFIVSMWLLAAATNVLATPVPSVKENCPPLDAQCRTHSEAWVEDQVRAGEQADLDKHCRQADAANARCTRLRPIFIRELIAENAQNQNLATRGLSIRNAIICAPKSQPDICDDAIPTRADPNLAQKLLSPFDTDPRAILAARAEPLDMSNLRTRIALDLVGNQFRCDLSFGGGYFEHVLNLDDTMIEGSVNFHNVRADGNISMVKAFIRGDVHADGLRGSGNFLLYGAIVQGIFHMRGAMLGRDLDLGRIIVLGPWPQHPPFLTKPLRASVGVPRSGVDLSNAHIGRQMYLSGATVIKSDVDLSGMTIGGSLWMEDNTKLPHHVTLERAHIGDSLMMGGGHFNQVDLSGVQVDHELRLEAGGIPTIWEGGRIGKDPKTKEPFKVDDSTWLVLRHARISAIRDTLTAWPTCVILDGFTYDRPPRDYAAWPKGDRVESNIYRWCIAPTPLKPPNDVSDDFNPADNQPYITKLDPDATPFWTRRDWARADRWQRLWGRAKEIEPEPDESRGIVWWRNWLERDPSRSSRSYVQLISALKAAGDGERADDVQFEQRIFERDMAGQLKYFLGWAEEILVGFGIGTYAIVTLIWALVLSLFLAHRLRGRLLAIRRAEADNKSFLWCFFASVQTLIPFVVISKQMDDFLHTPIEKGQPETQPLRGSLAICFSVLALFGLLLSGFLIHGLQTYAGL